MKKLTELGYFVFFFFGASLTRRIGCMLSSEIYASCFGRATVVSRARLGVIGHLSTMG